MRLWKLTAALFALILVVGIMAVRADVRYDKSEVVRLLDTWASGQGWTADELLRARQLAAAGAPIDLAQVTQPRPIMDDRRGGHNALDEYVWVETDFAWVDITATGTRATICDDCNEGPFEMGITVPFFDEDYTSMRICSNGWISPTSTSNSLGAFGPLVTPTEPNNAIYGFWEDLLPSGVGGTYWLADAANDRFIVAWVDCPRFGNPDQLYSFEIILYEDGRIILQYDNLTNNGGGGVGIENADGTEGLEICNSGEGSCPSNGTAYLIVDADGIPNPPTNLAANVTGTTVGLTWTDPTQDTNGNPVTLTNVQVWLGAPGVGVLLATVAPGTQAYTHTGAPGGDLTYYVRAYANPYYGSSATVDARVGSPTYDEGFDQSDGGWIAAGDADGFEWGVPTEAAGPAPHSEPNVWGVDLDGVYEDNGHYWVDLDIGLPVVSPVASLSCWVWYSTENTYDGCNLKVSVDGGATWNVVTPDEGYSVTALSPDNQWLGGEPGWCGNSGGWEQANFQLTGMVGQTPLFRFDFGADPIISTFAGFYFDDMIIWGLEPPTGATVTGHVTLDGGTGNVASVSVRANGLGNPTTNPNAGGNYTLNNVVIGDRLITGSLAGYETTSIAVTVPAGGYNGADLTLRRLPPSPVVLDSPSVANETGLVTLDWTASADPLVDQYRVYRKLHEGDVWEARDTFVQTEGTDQLTASGIWDYAIRAIDVDASTPVESANSNVMRVLYGEIPPTRLSANGNFDDHIHLTWWAPGVPPEVEASYDNGVNEVDGIGWWGFQPTFGWLVAHYQGTGPVAVTRLKSYITSFATEGDPFSVGVFAESGGQPTGDPLGVLELTQASPFDAFQEWTLEEPITFETGSFFIGMRQMTSNPICVGGDNTSAFPNNTFFYASDAGIWNAYEPNLMTIPMQRCFVIGDMGGELMELAPSPVESPYATRGPVAVPQHESVGGEAGRLMALAQKASVPAFAGDPAFRPGLNAVASWELAARAAGSTNARPAQVSGRSWALDARGRHSLDDLVNYRVYRDGALLASPVTESYDDFVAEGISYDYYVTGYYDNGEESGPTGTVTAMAAMAPAAPGNVLGSSLNNQTLRLTWTAPTENANGQPLVDLAGYRIFRDGVQIGQVAVGVTQFDDTPPQANQTYVWGVSGIDEIPNVGPAGTWSGSVVTPWAEGSYDWTEINGIGTNTGLTGDDQNMGPFDIGFPFTFYGNTYNSVRVCSNGWISFTDNSTVYFNQPIPNVAVPNNVIYGIWDDLYLPTGGTVYYHSDTQLGQFIVEWDHVNHIDGTGSFTFQIVLSSDNGVQINFMEIDHAATWLTGVENLTGTDAIQVCNDGAGEFIPTSETAVTFWGPEPVYANVTGHVTLDGGAGPMTSVTIAANGVSHPLTHPLANGDYTLEGVVVGARRIIASLAGYHSDTLIVTVPEGGIGNQNFTLVRTDPPVPTGLTGAVDANTGLVTLNWTQSPDPLVDQYKVWRKLQTEDEWVLVSTVTTNSATNQLPADNVYNFSVSAVDLNVSTPVESDRCPSITVVYGSIPPVRLIANGNFDDHIRLSWQPPGTNPVPPMELGYDDGSSETWFRVANPNGPSDYFAVRFTPPSSDSVNYPLDVQTVNILMERSDPIPQVIICPDNGGVPDLDNAYQTWTELGADSTPGWLIANADGEIQLPDEADFWVAWQFPEGIIGPGCGADNSDPDLRSYWTQGPPTWNQWTSNDWICRVWVGGPAESPSSFVLSSGEPTGYEITKGDAAQAAKSAGAAALKAKLSGAPRNTTVDAAGPVAASSWSKAVTPLRTLASTPSVRVRDQSISSRGGHGTLDDVVNYRIFRDGTAIATVPAAQLTYNDPRQENQPFDYYVTALYDNGEESGPSNTVLDARCNMAPGTPPTISLDPQGQSVMRVSWTAPTTNRDGTPLVDLAGYRIYRDDTQVGSVGQGVTQYMDQPPVPNEFYTWSVRAFDEVPNVGDPASRTGAVQSPWEIVDYEWEEINGIGTNTGMTGDDQNSGPFNIGFPFTFYGNEYTSVQICSNGWISFTDASVTYFNQPIPNPQVPNNVIYAIWDDLYLPTGGTVYYYSDPQEGRFIAEWDHINHIDGSGSFTFQIVLDDNDGILISYMEIDHGATWLTGVENLDGTEAIQLCNDGAGPWCPTSESAVQFWGGPAGLISGTVLGAPNNTPLQNVAVYVDGQMDTAYTAANGTYELGAEPGTVDVVFSLSGWCDTTVTGVIVTDGGETTVNATMRSPQAVFSVTSISQSTWPGHDVSSAFTISNPAGLCPLTYAISDDAGWLTCTPPTGTINPGQAREITAVMAVGNLTPGQEYSATIRISHSAPGLQYTIPVTLFVSTDVPPNGLPLPTEFAYHANYPNPFNATTAFRFDVPNESRVQIVLYNVTGQEVARPVDHVYQPGRYDVSFTADNLPSGMYVARMTAGSYTATGKLLLLK